MVRAVSAYADARACGLAETRRRPKARRRVILRANAASGVVGHRRAACRPAGEGAPDGAVLSVLIGRDCGLNRADAALDIFATGLGLKPGGGGPPGGFLGLSVLHLRSAVGSAAAAWCFACCTSARPRPVLHYARSTQARVQRRGVILRLAAIVSLPQR